MPGTDQTPERYEPADHQASPIVFEHWHRYAWARGLAAGKRVADAACGAGYGSALLAETALTVTGIDIDAATAARAALDYPRPNLSFRQGSIAALPLEDASIDLFVSFETIEHVDAATQAQMLAEVRRVLVPGGLFLVSTPNLDSPSYGDVENDFHVKEFHKTEFEDFLKASFGYVRLMGQDITLASHLFGPEAEGATVLSLASHGEIALSPAPLERAKFLIALCSDHPLPPVPASALADGDVTILGRLTAENAAHAAQRVKAESYAAELEERRAEAERYAAQLEERRAEAERYADSLKSITAQREADAAKAQHYAESLKATLTQREADAVQAEAYAASLKEALAAKDKNFAELEAYAASLAALRTEHEGKLAALAERIGQREYEINDLKEALAALEELRLVKAAKALQRFKSRRKEPQA